MAIMSGLALESAAERELWLSVYQSSAARRFTQMPDGLLEEIPDAKADAAVRAYRERCAPEPSAVNVFRQAAALRSIRGHGYPGRVAAGARDLASIIDWMVDTAAAGLEGSMFPELADPEPTPSSGPRAGLAGFTTCEMSDGELALVLTVDGYEGTAWLSRKMWETVYAAAGWDRVECPVCEGEPLDCSRCVGAPVGTRCRCLEGLWCDRCRGRGSIAKRPRVDVEALRDLATELDGGLPTSEFTVSRWAQVLRAALGDTPSSPTAESELVAGWFEDEGSALATLANLEGHPRRLCVSRDSACGWGVFVDTAAEEPPKPSGGAPTGPGWTSEPRDVHDLAAWGDWWWYDGRPVEVADYADSDGRCLRAALHRVTPRLETMDASRWGGPCIQGSAAIDDARHSMLTARAERDDCAARLAALIRAVESRAYALATLSAILRKQAADKQPADVATLIGSIDLHEQNLRAAVATAKGDA